MIGKSLTIVVATTGFLAMGAFSLWADDDDNNPAALAKALLEASVTLDQGLIASQREGKPVSGKYEIEHDALQLSVYTAAGGKFTEVIVDHKSGAIKKAEAITDADDLKKAKEQTQAMDGARLPLDQAVQNAVSSNAGYRAVSVIPALANNGPVANITLMKGEDVKKIMEKLN